MDGIGTEPERESKRPKAERRVKQVLVGRMGRGRTGGTTLLDWAIQFARGQGRAVAIGDGDRRNATLAGLYPPGTVGGATQPDSDEVPDVKDFMTSLLSDMVTSGSSLVSTWVVATACCRNMAGTLAWRSSASPPASTPLPFT